MWEKCICTGESGVLLEIVEFNVHTVDLKVTQVDNEVLILCMACSSNGGGKDRTISRGIGREVKMVSKALTDKV